MKQTSLVACALALALVLPGLRLTESGLQVNNSVSAQMLSPEPLPEAVTPDGALDHNTASDREIGPGHDTAPGRRTADGSRAIRGGTSDGAAMNRSQWQRFASTMRRVGESVKHQSANLLMALALAGMLLILFGVWLNQRLRRQIETAPLCKCGLPRGHCQWCRQGES